MTENKEPKSSVLDTLADKVEEPVISYKNETRIVTIHIHDFKDFYIIQIGNNIVKTTGTLEEVKERALNVYGILMLEELKEESNNEEATNKHENNKQDTEQMPIQSQD